MFLINEIDDQARNRLVAVFQSIIDERRLERRDGVAIKAKKDMMDALLDVEDENGRRLSDEEIIDILVMYLNAGHESSGHTMMWATVLLQQHPEFLQKAKVLLETLSCCTSGHLLFFWRSCSASQRYPKKPKKKKKLGSAAII